MSAPREAHDLEIDAFLAQAEHLSQLLANPAWAEWTALLTQMRASALEQLAVASDAAAIHYWQGYVGAIAAILERPARIVEAAADHQRTEEAEKQALRLELRGAIGMGVDHEGDV